MTSDISKCYSQYKFSFGDAINTAKTTALQCINEKMDEGKRIVDNAINDIKQTAQDVGDSAVLMALCNQYPITSVASLVAKVSCLGQVSD